jgi:hypothetical protein
MAGAELLVDAWSLHHAAGEMAGGPAPAERVTSLAVATRWELGAASVEPTVELRDWARGGSQAGRMTLVGARGRLAGPFGVALFPSVGMALGHLPARPEAALPAAAIRGWQLSLAVRR